MAMLETRYEHIVLSDSGTPTIVGSTMKVIELVREHQAYGWSVEELYFQHPYLSLGQIHSALAYYWDHKDELDADMMRRQTIAHTIQQTDSTMSASLRARVDARRDPNGA
jgi:uncharacterized protein (DUF433 family)